MTLSERPCACGCGRMVRRTRSNHRYYEDACRARASRRRLLQEGAGTPGRIASIRKLKHGRVSVTVHVDAADAHKVLQLDQGANVRLAEG